MIAPVRLFASSRYGRFGAGEDAALKASAVTSSIIIPEAQAATAPVEEDAATKDAQETAEPTAAPLRSAVNQRAAEFLTGGASVIFSFMASIYWTTARGMNIGKTAVNAVSWLSNISWIATVVEAVSLGWGIRAAYNDQFAAHGVETVLFNVGFALATVLGAGVLKSISLVAVYQLGEGDPTLNAATVITWFAFLWMFAWRSLHAWNDSFLLRMANVVSPDAAKVGSGSRVSHTQYRDGLTRRWKM